MTAPARTAVKHSRRYKLKDTDGELIPLTAEQQRLVTGNMKFALSSLGRFLRRCRVANSDAMFSATMMGLVEAARRFDPTVGKSFTTFAEYWIVNACHREVRQSHIVLPPFRDAGKSAHPERDLARQAAARTPTSPITDWSGILEDHSRPEFLPLEITEEVQSLLDRLNPQQRQVITLRFWRGMQQKDVAWIFGVSRQRINQIEQQAFALMRDKAQPVE